MSDSAGGTEQGILYAIPHGADVRVEGRDEMLVSERIHILEGGYVELVHKNSYERTILPRERVQEMKTHTREYEDKEWW